MFKFICIIIIINLNCKLFYEVKGITHVNKKLVEVINRCHSSLEEHYFSQNNNRGIIGKTVLSMGKYED